MYVQNADVDVDKNYTGVVSHLSTRVSPFHPGQSSVVAYPDCAHGGYGNIQLYMENLDPSEELFEDKEDFTEVDADDDDDDDADDFTEENFHDEVDFHLSPYCQRNSVDDGLSLMQRPARKRRRRWCTEQLYLRDPCGGIC